MTNTRYLEADLKELFATQARSIQGTMPANDSGVAPIVRLDDHRRPGRALMTAAAVLIVLVGLSATWWAVSNRSNQSTARGVETLTPTSAPEVVAPTSIVQPSTTVPTTTTILASTTTTAPLPDPTAVDMLVGWPAAPIAAPELAAVPRLLPSVPGANTVVRTEYADAASSAPYFTQTWVRKGTDPALLIITTMPGGLPGMSPNVATPTEVGSWDSSGLLMMSPGFTHLRLDDPSGTVGVWSNGLGDDTVLAIARSLSARRDGSTGWNLDPSIVPLTLFHEGWYTGVATRTIRWQQGDAIAAELSIVDGSSDALGLLPVGDGPMSIADVGGKTALVMDSGGRVAVLWAETPTVLVRFGLYGTVDEALAIARSMREVDAATWEAATVVDTSTNDGCNSMFC